MMADEPIPQPVGESQLLGVSIRGWLATLLVISVCAMSFFKIDIKEPLYTLVVMAVSFYFGQKSK